MISSDVTAVVFGYAFWTLFHSFGPMIWFFPLNELEISGYEAFVLAMFLPVILAVPFILSLAQNKIGNGFLRLFVAAGLLSFQAPTTILRLMVLIGGSSVAHLLFAADLTNRRVLPQKRALWGYVVGFFVMLTSRILHRTINPAWADANSNLFVSSIVFICAADGVISTDAPHDHHELRLPKSLKRPNRVFVGAALGSLIFLLQWVFGEVSVPSRWVGQGYPEPGPSPNPMGMAIYVALFAGLVLSRCQSVVSHPLWSLAATLGFYVLYLLPSVSGFSGAIILAIYASSQLPTILNLFAYCPPASTACVVVLVYLIEIFYSVWTVAYNFVPGGIYTREFSGALIALVMFCLAGLGSYCNRNAAQNTPRLHVAFREVPPADQYGFRRVLLCTLVVMLVAGGGWPSLERTVRLVNLLKADVLGFLETDASKPHMGNNDLAQYLAERLNYYQDFGPGPNKHTWGNMILSKYPIKNSTHFLLPSPEGELAPALTALLDLGGGKEMVVVLTHMGNDRDNLDRKLQAQELAKITAQFSTAKLPVVFIGYVTSKPGSRDYRTLLTDGKLKDIDQGDRSRFCQYIMYNNMQRLGYARVSHGGLTDTEVQMARFRVRVGHADIPDNDRVETEPSRVPPRQRFSSAFGEFYKGHFSEHEHHYHMDTPKYFLPAENPKKLTNEN